VKVSPEGIWRKIDEVERAVAIRVASAIAIRNVDNYVDLKVIVMRLSEATWDKECRKHIVKCVRGNHDDKSRFCCILAILGLAKLRKRYCK
jgi:hypothetical protein